MTSEKSTASSSIPRSCTRPKAAPCSGISPTGSPAAGATGPWRAFARRQFGRVREQVGSGRVICGLSGGVDSAVTALLVHEAIGDQLTCILVDTGLLRAGEALEVLELFRERFNIPLDLAGTRRTCSSSGSRGSAIRSRSGRSSAGVHRCVREGGEATGKNRIPGAGHPLSGRDRSASFRARGPIKSHHNVGGLPERMNLELVEPRAQAVQGRGPRPRARARPARNVRRSPSVSGSRPGGAILGEITESASSCCARPT